MLLLGSCKSFTPTEIQKPTPISKISFINIIPLPDSIESAKGSFVLTENTAVYVNPASIELLEIGQFLADRINSSTGYSIKVLPTTGVPMEGNFYFTTSGASVSLGEEGYELKVTNDLVTVAAHQPAGLFRAVQTIRQLLPSSIESSSIQSGPWRIPTVTIRDFPRFVWRGAMLDVARHFFRVKDIERFIDEMVYYKLNRLHLHLTDDQGWRIVINSWPKLVTIGGSSQTGGAVGGYYTQAEYSEIVTYAQKRYIMVVPEIDMPGHTNAALASYAELNCNGVTPPLYTGINVGFSTLCVNKETSFAFVEDVVKEICAITPGHYIHIGGDEATATNDTDYIRFIDRVQFIVQSYNKQLIGWEEISRAHLLPASIAQYWERNLIQMAIQQGMKVIMSPASKAYLDMKYNSSSILGQDWAGYIEVRDAYNWDPANLVSNVSESNVLGVEAPLWTETIQTIADIEYMMFPRLVGYAEIGWSQQAKRNWDDYKVRLANHGTRLTALGVNYYRSPQISWK